MLRIEACSAIRVEDRVGFAQDGLAIEFNRTVVILGSICGVASRLQFGSEGFPLLGRNIPYGSLIDLCKLIGGLNRCSLRLSLSCVGLLRIFCLVSSLLLLAFVLFAA